jgi:hypothetical protein
MELLCAWKGSFMKKVDENANELRPEYQRENFGQMVRGKYVERVRESSNLVVLDPDVAEAFPNSKAVNDTLRRLINLAKSTVHGASRE